MKPSIQILRQDEAMTLLRSVTDPISNQLMNRAVFFVTRRFTTDAESFVTDFDLLLFMEIMKEFCIEHSALRRILEGEDLRLWWEEEESP